MRQKFFWLDLGICSLWMLITLANCSWWSLSTHLLMVVMVVMRIILSFSLYHREKRSWLPLVVFSALFALLSDEGLVMRTTGIFADLFFDVLGINNDHLAYDITKCILLAWLLLVPLTVYIVGLCKKTIKSSNMTRMDSLGAILWKDKGARLYCLLMLGAICALHSGLAMDNRMCRFACLVLSPLSFCLIARHVTYCKDTSEKMPMVGKLWLMVSAMVLFFCAQRYAEIWRVSMLVTSISIVAYVCWRTFGKQGFAGICILATIYLGIFLPSVAIGYNQYACIKYGRQDLYPLGANNILRIKDLKTNEMGLRDRYGMLIKPAYEGIVPNSRVFPFGVYELRNNELIMLVIHPKDKTTAMLSALYDGLEAQVITDCRSTKEMAHLLHHVSTQERIMLLGHGSDKGLFFREDDSKNEFDKIIVGHSHRYHLHNHGGNIVAVWCNADQFARTEGLHGLFTGMIVSELDEALLYQVETTQEELDRENVKLARRLRTLLDERIPLSEIPKRMLAMDDVHSPLTTFNYKNFYYL